MSKPWDALRKPDKPVVHPIAPGHWYTCGGTGIEYVPHNSSDGFNDLDIKINNVLHEMTLLSWRDFHGFLGELLDQLEGK